MLFEKRFAKAYNLLQQHQSDSLPEELHGCVQNECYSVISTVDFNIAHLLG